MTFFKYGNFDAITKHSSGAVTPEEVDARITEALEAVDSKYDDAKIYESLSDFPQPGTTDVLYTAQDTGYQYIWNGSDYEAIREALSEAEIKNLIV